MSARRVWRGVRPSLNISDLNLDALGTCAHGGCDSHLDGTAVGDLALDLAGDVRGHNLGIELRALHLIHVNLYLLVGDLLELFLELVDILAALADDEAGARGADGDGDEFHCALDDDARNA